MKICIVGWYFFESLYASLKEVNKKHEVTIISHKGWECSPEENGDSKDLSLTSDPEAVEAREFLESCGLNYKIIPNIGLEFGAYDYYLKNCWDKESDVLFI